MAPCSITAKADSESRMLPNWLELPRDITTSILQRLGTVEIVTSACLVCPLWWNICKDPLMWHTIHMTNFIRLFHKNHSDDLKICCYAVERSCGHLIDINIKFFANDDLLECIAENASNLQNVQLLNCLSISDKGFIEAVRKFSQLEKLDISHCNLSNVSLEVLGRSCTLLKSLIFKRFGSEYQGGDDNEALVISETMTGLCHLDIEGNRLTNVGLLSVLDKCPLLEYLDIQECYNLNLTQDLTKRCLEQIKVILLPNPNNHEDFDEYSDYYYEDFDNGYYDDIVEGYFDNACWKWQLANLFVAGSEARAVAVNENGDSGAVAGSVDSGTVLESDSAVEAEALSAAVSAWRLLMPVFQELQAILQQQVLKSDEDDSFKWRLNLDGIFSVKSCYDHFKVKLSGLPLNNEKWFKEVRKWNPREVDNERMAWVRVFGVPSQAWNHIFFDFISLSVGSLLREDESTEGKLKMEVARLLIRTKSFTMINEEIKITVDNDVFNILMLEEA
ncbi:F-box protein SKIP19-like [Vicia villosa]|uniref:F-box protein SKIP19-like n=1 Tax=Vicia villosa TaxID=3911 RepID=UPI00273ACBA3|nr:F-box protein SKIP19-like [Vicia villosa]